MNVTLGTISFLPAKEHLELMAGPTAKALADIPKADDIGVAEVDPALSDTAAFCEQYGIGSEQAANCIVLEAKRGDKTWFAACVILGNARADVNGLARKTLDARKVSFASMEKAVAETGMEYGAITPVGLPPAWPVLVDKAVADAAHVIVGSGIRKSKIAIPGNALAFLPNAVVLDGLGRAGS